MSECKKCAESAERAEHTEKRLRVLEDALEAIANENVSAPKGKVYQTLARFARAALWAVETRHVCKSCTPERECPDHGPSLTDFEGERRPAETTSQEGQPK